MARIAGVDLPRDKRGEVALTYIYGVGRSTSRRVFAQASVDANRRVKDWTEDETARVREVLEREAKVEVLRHAPDAWVWSTDGPIPTLPAAHGTRT